MNTPDTIALDAGRFLYDLPESAIAAYPVAERDRSKLLVADATTGTIEHDTFTTIAQRLPAHSVLVVNASRVIAARIHARKPSGGAVEVLLTSPVAPSADPAVVLAHRGPSEWNCLIGGKNVQEGMTLEAQGLHFVVVQRRGAEATVRVHTPGDAPLTDVLPLSGTLPLPPYLKRPAEASDAERYQTVYARVDGSVAAPTAGLHFTDAVMAELAERGVERHEVLLHVGLGTFKPMDVQNVADHTMHTERIGITLADVRALTAAAATDRWFTVVGTTSLRTMESLYWLGARLLQGDTPVDDTFHIEQWSAFGTFRPHRAEALQAVARWMDARGLEQVWGSTQLMVAPGCHIGTADALITNFHQPGNTLLLLVAGFVGDPFWRHIYEEALGKGYRFLSYGDSSLLVRSTMRT